MKYKDNFRIRRKYGKRFKMAERKEKKGTKCNKRKMLENFNLVIEKTKKSDTCIHKNLFGTSRKFNITGD